MGGDTGEKFISPTLGELSISEVVNEVCKFVGLDCYAFYRLIIGTDSQTRKSNSEAEIDFVTAIVIHRRGSGGRYFWIRERQRKHYVLRQKIYTETAKSLALAEELVPLIRSKIPPGVYDLEIHIDVGTVGPTREMIKEVVGMVTGSGYTAKTKPESYGASSVADRHT
ncbi:MAG: ribonuclease H-like YkuK family protein [Candidatus Blackburnbacteria bacterium]|nr:ribonuclease H-like YkuK family protein [Candidatus Blackburnbacteria bacterium]